MVMGAAAGAAAGAGDGGEAAGAAAGAGAAGAAAGYHPYLDFPPGSEARRSCDKLRNKEVGGHFYIDWGFIDSVGETERLRDIIGYNTPWSRLFQSATEVSFRELTVEFLSSFEVVGEPYREISFRLAGVQRRMTLEEFAVASGLYLPDEIHQPIYTDAVDALPRQPLISFYRFIAVTHFGKSQGKASMFRDPLYIYLHHAIATSIAPRGQGRDKVTTTDLFFLYCLLFGRPCALAVGLVKFYHTAHHRKPTGQLFGGAYVTVLARHFGLQPEADPLLSPAIPSSPLANANARSIGITHKVRKGVYTLRSPNGPDAPFVPVPLPAADDIPVFLEEADGVPAVAPPEPQAEDVVHGGPEPPQQQWPRHMYDDLPPAMRLVVEDFARQIRRDHRRNRSNWMWHRQSMQLMAAGMSVDLPPSPEDVPSDGDE